jgi:hypothetical protein
MGGGAKISRSAPRTHAVHLDTCYARPILLDWDTDPDILDTARNLVYRKRVPPPTVSLATLGEVLVTVSNSAFGKRIPAGHVENIGPRLVDLVESGQLVICGLGYCGGEKELGEWIATIEARDDRIDLADKLIVASALSCGECKTLLTSDAKLIDSRGLREMANEGQVTIRPA